MSQYSSCAGHEPENGFSTDQKARMYAYHIAYRRGYLEKECRPITVKTVKRSSMQDLIEGRCPDIEKQVELIQGQPTQPAAPEKKNAAVFSRSVSMGCVLGAVSAVVVSMFC